MYVCKAETEAAQKWLASPLVRTSNPWSEYFSSMTGAITLRRTTRGHVLNDIFSLLQSRSWYTVSKYKLLNYVYSYKSDLHPLIINLTWDRVSVCGHKLAALQSHSYIHTPCIVVPYVALVMQETTNQIVNCVFSVCSKVYEISLLLHDFEPYNNVSGDFKNNFWVCKVPFLRLHRYFFCLMRKWKGFEKSYSEEMFFTIEKYLSFVGG